MAYIEYRMFFNDRPATREQLDRVEEITVEQEVDMAWEARVEIPVTVDAQGRWADEDADFMGAFSRVRVEIKIGNGGFVPLIDGPVAARDNQRSSQPGASSAFLVIHDDSVYLNREEQVLRFENRLDHEIARDIFGQYSDRIKSTDIESTPSSGSAIPTTVIQRGTAMQILRALARRQGMHAYVLPGEGPGESIGCFKAFPAAGGIGGSGPALPPLVLLGSERNTASFDVSDDAQSPATVTGSTLRITDKQVITRTCRYGDLDLLGDEAASGTAESGDAVRILPPYQGESVDLDQAVSAEAARVSYAFDARGQVMGHRYPAVLRPYLLIRAMAGGTSSSGDYVITKVTHSLTRSEYSQTFGLRRNARTSLSIGSLDSMIGSIF